MSQTELRGVWLTTTDSTVFQSPDTIMTAMDFLAEIGFNVVFPVVWKQAATLFPSRVLATTLGTTPQTISQNRDILAEVITAAHQFELKVIPWFEYGFASSYKSNGGKLLQHHPEWSGRDRQGNLLSKNGFEWMNALHPQVQNFMLDMILEVVQNYDIDGIQGDDRLPAFPSEGGYDQYTCDRYQQEFGCPPPANPKDKRWLQWRADILTDFLAQLYQQIKAINPHLIVSMAPSIPGWALQEYLQDITTWLERGLVDFVHPQAYRRDFRSYQGIINSLVWDYGKKGYLSRLAPGILIKIGNYTINPDYLRQAIAYNRSRGINGEVFFFYEGLHANNNQLAKILKTIYTQPAKFPPTTL